MTRNAVIFEAIGANPAVDRVVRGDLVIVAIGQTEQMIEVATALARDGAELIELCGGISPRWRPIVGAAVGPHVRVSSVTFGIESLVPAFRYNQAYLEGTPPPFALIVIDARSGAAEDRLVKTFGPQQIIYAMVRDESSAPAVARALIEDGVGLIELYGGFTSAGAAAVIDAVESRAAVGIGSFTLEATIPVAPKVMA